MPRNLLFFKYLVRAPRHLKPLLQPIWKARMEDFAQARHLSWRKPIKKSPENQRDRRFWRCSASSRFSRVLAVLAVIGAKTPSPRREEGGKEAAYSAAIAWG
jgi:hypothetical protein